MPGTLVHDAAIPALSSGTFTTTTNGAWVSTGQVNVKRIRLQVAGAVTGTTPTLDVAIQAADDGSGTNTVTLGRFSQSTAVVASPGKFIDVDGQKPFMRAVLTITGTTPSFGGVTVSVEEERYLRTNTDTA